MEVFQFLYRVKDTLSIDDFASLLNILSSDKFSTHMIQINKQFKPIFKDTTRQHFLPEFNSMMEKATMDPKYESTISRVADVFTLLKQVHSQFPRSEFSRFINCYEFDHMDVTHEKIINNLELFKKRLPPILKERLNLILSQQQQQLLDDDIYHQQHMDGFFFNNDGASMLENDGMIEDNNNNNNNNNMDIYQENQSSSLSQLQQRQIISQQQQDQNLLHQPIMVTLFQQVYNIFQNDSLLCRQFFEIIHTNYIHNVDFSESILHTYRWIQTVNPSLWSSLSPVLEQMILYVDSTTETYDSYEDFIEKNFMNQDDQLYLNNEIEQARVQHIFSKLTI
ncbi:unnamed protein product [Cunninghamella blakesleeana]